MPTLVPELMCKHPGCGQPREPNLDYCRGHEGGFEVPGPMGRTARERITEFVDAKPVAFSGAGVKHDLGKPRYDLVPTKALREFVEVLTFGAKKYTANGWRKVVGWRWRYSRAALTHVFAWLGGQARDPETGLHHLAHALCCVFFVLEHELVLELGTDAEKALVPDGDAEAPPGSQGATVFKNEASLQVGWTNLSATTPRLLCGETVHVWSNGAGAGCQCGRFK